MLRQRFRKHGNKGQVLSCKVVGNGGFLFLCLFIRFETRSHSAAQNGLKLTAYPRLTSGFTLELTSFSPLSLSVCACARACVRVRVCMHAHVCMHARVCTYGLMYARQALCTRATFPVSCDGQVLNIIVSARCLHRHTCGRAHVAVRR